MVHRLAIHRFKTGEPPGPDINIVQRAIMDSLLLKEVQDPPLTSRQIVLQDNFGPGYQSRLPWDFLNQDVAEVHTTLNDSGAVTLTWPQGALPNVRWGGHLDIGGAYEEVWITQEMRLEANWVPGPTEDFGTGKIFGVGPANQITGCQNVNCPANNWSFRLVWGGDSNPDEVLHPLYMYYPEKPVNCGQGFGLTHIQKEVLITAELHWKLNSAAGVEDGIAEMRIDGSLVESQNFAFYCGDELQRPGAFADHMINNMQYGGGGSGWAPYRDSSITLGAFKVEALLPEEPGP